MRYGNYDRRYMGTSYERRGYNDSSYGRREKYKGHEYIDEMYGEYDRYSENKYRANSGEYSAKPEALKSLEYMLESMVDFVEMLKSDASSPEEHQMINEYIKRIASM